LLIRIQFSRFCHEIRDQPINWDDMEETFHKLCIPELFSKILRHLTMKDRLNLRLCSRGAENAVSRTDLHVIGQNRQLPIIRIDGRWRRLTVSLGERVKLKAKFDPTELEELLRMRQRLFTRAYSYHVEIKNINFNLVPITCLEKLLDGCVFDQLSIVFNQKKFSSDVFEFIRKNEKKAKISMATTKFLMDRNMVLSFEAMETLQMLNTTIQGLTVFEGLFLDLVRKRHRELELPVANISDEFILSIVEAMKANDGEQR
ncbi:hypothetical protein PENTCL1PPCAC_20346, partial [Pristionchus entomophagus]